MNGYANNPENSSTKKKMGSMFLVNIQCQQFGHVKRVKTNITYITEKIV